MRELLKELIEDIGEEYFSFSQEMKNHTTFKIGGRVACMIFPITIEMIKKSTLFLQKKNIRFFIMGKGSNLLVDDKGYDGVIIKIADNFGFSKIEGNKAYVQAGVSMNELAFLLANYELKGFEPLSGIPGTIGGAISMNAGAYECEISKFVENVEAMDRDGNIHIFNREDMNFGYRKSIILEKKMIVLSTTLVFEKGNKQTIMDNIEDYRQRRAFRQPLEYGSAGSMFKRPVGYYAGKLIDDCHLRGFSINDAQVSEKHAGFVINKGNATFQDVITLVNVVKDKVKEEFGVELEEEVRIIYHS